MLRTKLTHKRWLLLLLCLVAVLILLSPNLEKRPLNFVAKPTTDLLSWFQGGILWVTGGISSTWEGYMNLVGAKIENKKLSGEVELLQNKILQLSELALQNERLQKLLNFKDSSPLNLTAARVLGRDATNWYKTIMINKGILDGLEPGMGVLTPSGVVGKIIRTTDTSSQVLLVTDHRSSIAGIIQRTREEGLVEGAEGNKGSQSKIKYLPSLSSVQDGDLVLTSGLAEIFPKGLLIGSVSKVQKKESELFKVAQIKPAVNLKKLEEVLVIVGP